MHPRLAPFFVLMACAACSGGGGTTPDPTVTLTLRLDGGGTASVTSDPPGLACASGSCSGTFPRGSSLTLTAVPDSARWVRWGGGCSGTATTCVLAVTGDRQVSATFLGANYAFVTSSVYSPGGLSRDAADAACAASAASAGLPGRFVAWRATAAESAVTRLGTARGWVRPDGLPFVDAAASLLAGHIFYPLAVTELGQEAVGGVVLTGTLESGAAASQDCLGWTSGAANEGLIIGDRTGGPMAWTNAGGTSCTILGRLYCFGTDIAQEVTVSPATGRKAFVTRATWGGGGGLGALDALCAAEASSAGLSGAFLAFAATSNASAASRFNLAGAPWVRPDGVRIVAAAADLVAQLRPLLAPIALHADGSPADRYWAWVGSHTPSGAGTATCSDWTDSTAAASGAVGAVGSGEDWLSGTATLTCDKPAQVYCLER